MSATAHVVFAGGGTGGHLFPGIAVAHAVRRLIPSSAITFFTTDRPLDRQLLAPPGFEQIAQRVRPLSLSPLRWPAFWLAWRASVRAAARWMREYKPVAVLGLGGYAAGPPVVAAAALGIRTAILNPDAIPGRANRYLARRVDLIVTQWEVSRREFPARANCRAWGCPIRREFCEGGADAAAARRKFGLDEDRPTLLVTGASQGARSVNETMWRIWPALLREQPRWQLLHLTGAADEAATRDAYDAAGAAARVVAFTHEMRTALAAADLVVSRAGASTLAELTALGKPSILLPYPYHRDRHQHANARVLVDAGAALLVEDERDAARNEAPLCAALREALRPERLSQLSRAAETLARPTAADRVAEWLVGE